jgi:hypothetical protein
VIEILADAAAEGRLTLEEYSARSDAALGARTRGELAVVTADLPESSGLPAAAASTAPAEQISVLLGNESRKGRWVVPPHLFIRSVLSDCHLELQQAVIRPGAPVIEVRCDIFCGSVNVRRPKLLMRW